MIHRATSEFALIEGPEGVWWVTPGMTLPGIGQIISIERSDNGWVVLTSETMISRGRLQARKLRDAIEHRSKSGIVFPWSDALRHERGCTRSCQFRSSWWPSRSGAA